MGKPVANTEENAKQCICPDCPTFMKSKLSSVLFCARGKAAETAQAAGCICTSCPIYKKVQLSQMYYCLQGASKDLKS
ncbi:MAG: DUF2769 domain-containing protein [Candidatus Bathyarchaeota archaeon]|nr:DUF2769 domain-containing protein [Candidatus Bathyarchaeota archaeon]